MCPVCDSDARIYYLIGTVDGDLFLRVNDAITLSRMVVRYLSVDSALKCHDIDTSNMIFLLLASQDL